MRLWKWSLQLAVGAAAAILIVLAWTFWPPSPSPLPDPARTFYERGQHYLREEGGTVSSLDDAVQMFNRALQRSPDLSLAWAGLGEAYWRRFDLSREPHYREEALKAVGRALELDPSLIEARNARARGFLAEGEYQRAKQELENILAERPDFDVAWASLGRAHRELEEYSEGREALEKAISLNPKSSQHEISLGIFFGRFNEFKEAVKAYRRAIDLKPDAPQAWSNLGASYLHLGLPEEAAEALRNSIAIEESADARTNLGTAYFFLEEFATAEDNYRRATELEPGDEVYWGNLGDALAAQHKQEEAHEAYGEAVRLARINVELAVNQPLAHMTLGLWCARIRDVECALKEGNVAAELQPDNSRILFRKAVIHTVVGQQDVALDLLERAVGLGLRRMEIENDLDLKPLRSNERYQHILRLAR